MLPKFLISVSWERPNEREAAIKLMYDWAPIDIDQALAMLSGLFSLNNVINHMRVVQNATEEIIKKFKEIRNHAVKSLSQVKDEKFDLYMLYLV